MFIRLPAEWEEQEGVLLAWPHQESDWAPILGEARSVTAEIIRMIVRFEKVFLLVPNARDAERQLKDAGISLGRVKFFEYLTNDTWTRDFGPITVFCRRVLEKKERPLLLDFGFNGWGLKFAADRDNRVNRYLATQKPFRGFELRTRGMVLEGGSIESDGKGTILTTAQCLLSENRNPHLTRMKIEKKLKSFLGAERFLWLTRGHLEGDDTDAHIDTLARLCPSDTILYVSCDDKSDPHYKDLKKMREELEKFRNPCGEPYRLIPLPWPQPLLDEEGKRLPATYANFLVVNGAVIVPVYGDPADEEALRAVKEAFPDREIVAVDCRTLVRQHGSLHCVTMQIPAGIR